MTIELSDNTYYLEYLKKRDSLPLYYCHNPYIWSFDKGYYRCGEIDENYVKVYCTAKGTKIPRQIFDAAFKKPTKLQLFLHKHFWWI
jgi:hypothetical protein